MLVNIPNVLESVCVVIDIKVPLLYYTGATSSCIQRIHTSVVVTATRRII